MGKAIETTTRSAPAPIYAPKPLSAFLLRERRLRLLAKRQRRHDLHRRRVTALRLAEVEEILKQLIENSDVLARVTLNRRFYDETAVALLVTMPDNWFDRLCQLGAELEDMEDSTDAEPTEADHGEMALGWGTSPGILCGSADEDEASLGSLGMADQRRWSDGARGEGAWSHGTDLEHDPSEREPSLGAPESHFGAASPLNTEGNGGIGACHHVHSQTYWADGSCLDLESADEDDEPDYRKVGAQGVQS
jgi:hypothetical protein